MDKFKVSKEFPQSESKYYQLSMRTELAWTLTYATIFIKLLSNQLYQLRKYSIQVLKGEKA